MSDTRDISSSRKTMADSTSEVLAGLIAICVWFTLFVAGFSFPTKAYRHILMGDAGIGEKLPAFFVVVFCFTPTNAAMLCCVASVLGGIFRRMRARQRQRLVAPSLLVLLLSLVFQGFVVYLVMASGILSFGGLGHFFDNPTRDQYIRLAATCSLISLMIGYSPGLFNSLMGRLEKWLRQGVALGAAAPSAKVPREVKEGEMVRSQ